MSDLTFLSPNGAGSIVRLAMRDLNKHAEEQLSNTPKGDVPVVVKTAGECFYKYVPEWIKDRMTQEEVRELHDIHTARELAKHVNLFVTGVSYDSGNYRT